MADSKKHDRSWGGCCVEHCQISIGLPPVTISLERRRSPCSNERRRSPFSPPGSEPQLNLSLGERSDSNASPHPPKLQLLPLLQGPLTWPAWWLGFAWGCLTTEHGTTSGLCPSGRFLPQRGPRRRPEQPAKESCESGRTGRGRRPGCSGARGDRLRHRDPA